MSRRLPGLDRWRRYRAAVLHPEAEARFYLRAWQRSGNSHRPELFCEDFSGPAAVAQAWVLLDPDHQAMAIDQDEQALAVGQAWWAALGREREDDLHLVHGDVSAVRGPKVDIISATNFSTFIFHDRRQLLTYFRSARRRLLSGGLMVIDAFGGPGAVKPGTQWRAVEPDDASLPAFEYGWEQRTFNAVSNRIDCRIHFRLTDGRVIANAFRYDWRLWTLPELVEAMREAGFADARVWHDGVGDRSGRFKPTEKMVNADAFVAYVVGRKG